MPIVEAEETVEVLLLGTGQVTCLLPKAVRESLRAKGIAIEVMDTGAACRTYNVLATEGRLVAAALIAVE
ncbi:MAG: MTH938/NDUFAF3 family protein [Alphaproteobacteria bacterium]